MIIKKKKMMRSTSRLSWVSVVRLWVCLEVVLLLLLNGQWMCLGCWEEEGSALLQFKASLNWTRDDGTVRPGLTSWVTFPRDADCCDWERVACDLNTRRVIHLSLHNLRETHTDSIPAPVLAPLSEVYFVGDWVVNASLFLPFHQLQHLNLSHNAIRGWLPNQGFEKLSNLKKLEVLDLSWNSFPDSDFKSLIELPSLKQLHIRANYFISKGPFFLQGLKQLGLSTKLEIVDLSENWLSNDVLQSLSTFTSLKVLKIGANYLNGSFASRGLQFLPRCLKTLEELDLSSNEFDRSILPYLNKFRGLRNLNLCHNPLNSPAGLLDITGASFKTIEVLYLCVSRVDNSILPLLVPLTSLKELDLSDNRLNGSLPSGFCNLKNLQKLYLGLNDFEGTLPTCLNNLTSLRVLDLYGNQFTGRISSSPIANFTSLESISLDYNNFDANHEYVPKSQLREFSCSYCNFNKPVDVALKFLNNQFELRVLHLSHAGLQGDFPNWLIKNNTKLESLELRNNSLTGLFHMPSYHHMSLTWIDISKNRIRGNVQADIGEILPNLHGLLLSSNSFQGKIPSSIGDMRELVVLDFSNNNFSGVLPQSLGENCIYLVKLKLSNNNLSGQIFPGGFNMPNLQFLELEGNHFIGSIPVGISKCAFLEALKVGKNHLSGQITSWIGNFTWLTMLDLRDNLFTGSIPNELCRLDYFEFLDLSKNQLSGSIPSCFQLPHLSFIHLQGNRLTGSIPYGFRHSGWLVTMNIGDNNLFGNIPSWIGSLGSLEVLALGRNNLSGVVPHELCQLNNLGILDLSHNNLMGQIPPCFKDIAFGIDMGYIKQVVGSSILGFMPFGMFKYMPESLSRVALRVYDLEDEDEEEEVKLVTKSISLSYKGSILDYMSGLDLSCNNLTGEIPFEIGDLNALHAMNLSHNQLCGRIPKAFSNLTQLESLDISHNNLTGEIPSSLTEMNSLEVFSVAFNNLSGRIPDQRQFGTFNDTSYEGNSLLCGTPLNKSCSPAIPPGNEANTQNNADEESKNRFGIDSISFLVSFAVTYLMCLLVFAIVLYINAYWRRRWFRLVDGWIDACSYFLIDLYYKVFIHPFM